MSRLIGIDLGTTNSCVAVIEGGTSVIIPNESGERTTPSVVAFTKEGERLVGQTAKRQAVVNPERTVSSIKREMGTDHKVTIDGRKYSPQEISAMILQKLKSIAESYLGEPVTEAVITVPAYFTDSQRQATKDAGIIAGLNVQRIINEPTAAALAYGIDKEESQKVLVYDLGGGTFDVSVLDINQGMIEVIATSGNNRLGGDDFDACITDYIVSEFKKETKCDIKKDISALSRVREAAEKAKVELSSMEMTTINLPFLVSDKNDPRHLEMTLTRAKFNSLTEHLVAATMEPVRQALKDSRLSPQDISKVLLVGGSSRIPAVQAAVRQYTEKAPFKGINPDECVAMGASLQAGVLSGSVQGLLLLDVTPLSLGIETLGGVFSKIIDRNTTLPIRKSEIYTTAANYQTSVEVHVLQGERELAQYNKTLAKFKLDGIRRVPRGVPQIEVTFEIDVNGIVNVFAKDLGTGKQQNIVITASSNLSKDEIDRAVRDAKLYAEEDRKKKEEATATNDAEALIYRAASVSKKLNKDDRKRLEEQVKQVKRLMKEKNPSELAEACRELSQMLSVMESSAGMDREDDSYANTEPEYHDTDFDDKNEN